MGPINAITSVERGPRFWKITDARGTKYATKSDIMAALCDRYRKLGTDVVLVANSGWIYKQLVDIYPRVAKDTAVNQ